jgi:hypothetical protein
MIRPGHLEKGRMRGKPAPNPLSMGISEAR